MLQSLTIPEKGTIYPFTKKATLCGFFDYRCEAIVEQLFDKSACVGRGHHFVHEGDDPSAIFLLQSGWAARCTYVQDGRRQIVELLLPGDMFPVHAMVTDAIGEDIVALSDCRSVTCAPAAMEEALFDDVDLSRLMAWLTRREKNILRAWIINLGQRDSYARTAHLICELNARLAQSGYIHDGEFEMPLTQDDLADVIGTTSAHVNRTLRQMSRDRIFELRHRRARVLDAARLKQIAGFDGDYLTPR